MHIEINCLSYESSLLVSCRRGRMGLCFALQSRTVFPREFTDQDEVNMVYDKEMIKKVKITAW